MATDPVRIPGHPPFEDGRARLRVRGAAVRRALRGLRGAVVVAAVVVALTAFAVDAAPAGITAAADAATKVPVILVHGYGGSPASFGVMAERLERRGHTVVSIALPGNDNVANARAIRDLVAARGWTKVAIVGHSMGGLSSREWIRFYGGRKVAVTYVSLGTPQLGLAVACVAPPTNGGQMCPGSPFLKALNAGDMTPGTLRWTSVASTTDELVPVAATRLAGGACNVRVTGPDHGGLLTDPAVFRIVAYAIDGRPCPGTFVR
jgi:triacylglycerol lipase